ncbi:MAG: DUF4834 family protein [Rikenellaceae bacterium]
MIKSNPLLWIIIFLAVVAPSFLFGAMKVVIYIILGIILLFVILSAIFSFKIQTMRSKIEDQMRGGAGNSSQNPFGQNSSAQNPFGQNKSSRGGAKRQNNEGDVKIYASSQSQEKKVSKDVGDYVDFEEIKK